MKVHIEEDLMVTQRISWDTHGDPSQLGNVRRSGYITALKDASGYYSIRADAGEMQYMRRERFIAHNCDRDYKALR